MQYFDTLPKIIYTDQYGIRRIKTNIMARTNIIPQVLKNPLLYYSYDIQDSDTPEIIAHKYYNDMYRYWLVLLANQMMDPQWNWPLNYNSFQLYLKDKYGTQNIHNTVQQYQKIITQFDAGTQTTTTNTLIIDQDTYNSLIPSTNTYTLPTGNVTVTISKNTVSVYDYENNLNEAKRNIKLLGVQYVDEMESEFVKLMS